jgi:uncharacterized membrane protein
VDPASGYWLIVRVGSGVLALWGACHPGKLNRLLSTTTVGAVSGAFWGSLIGLIFLMPLVGGAIGAASGALGGALTDVGLNDKWMKDTAAAIQPRTARGSFPSRRGAKLPAG